MEQRTGVVTTLLRVSVVCLVPFAALTFRSLPAGAEVLQTQMGVNGVIEADVIRARSDGRVLTVAIVLRNGGEAPRRLRGNPADFYFVDARGAKKYFPLKDAGNRWVAGPINKWGDFDITVPAKGRTMIWLKFPAPPADSPVINLATPFTLPFDGLKVQR